MNNPDLYYKANALQRLESERIIVEYSSKIQWRRDGCDTLIDLGSGTGDVLMDFLYPRMPSNFHRIVCSDINPKMVNYARSQYGQIAGAEFKVFDMGTQRGLPHDLGEQFDHVTSFYSLMWVQNQRQCFKNIFQLLRREGGDCLLLSLASHPIFDAYKLSSQMEKWAIYMPDVDSFISPQQSAKDAGRDFRQLMAETGFCDYDVDLQHREYIFDSVEAFKTNMIAINPFLDRIPESLQDDYMNDLVSIVSKGLGLKISAVFPVPYRLLIVYARKASIICP